jgi:hypothetical protein
MNHYSCTKYVALRRLRLDRRQKGDGGAFTWARGATHLSHGAQARERQRLGWTQLAKTASRLSSSGGHATQGRTCLRHTIIK